MAWHGRLPCPRPPDNPLAQCLEIKGQEWEGHGLGTAGGDQGRQGKYKDSDIKLRASKVKA